MTSPTATSATRSRCTHPTGARTVGPAELGRLRFAVSPVWEAVASLKVLQGQGSTLHDPWAQVARPRVRDAGLDLGLLLALVPRAGHLADFVTPTPHGREGSMTEALTDVREAATEVVEQDLRILLSESPTPSSREALVAGLRDPASVRGRAADDLEAYFEVAVAPVWERLRGLGESDIAWRLEQIASGGLHQVLGTLHPRLRMEGEQLVVERACQPGPTTSGGGLVLVPCAFAFPGLLFLDMPGHSPTASYGPRGVGTLWREAPDATGTALADLVGRTRAGAVVLLDLPMTTSQLACHLDVTPPTMSQHLQVMARAGLVAARRRGREVLYARTQLGDLLVASTHPRGPSVGADR